MTIHSPSAVRIAFGPFEVDARAGELRKGGVRLRLSGQPVEILLLLLAAPGEVVTREELRDQLWADGTSVDFEHGLNAAINKLRRALNDSAERPRYVETVTGRGYRFIGVLERPADTSRTVPVELGIGTASATLHASTRDGNGRVRWWRLSAAVELCVIALLLIGWLVRERPTSEPAWRITRLTAEHGIADDASLSPDGRLVAYSSDRAAAADTAPPTGGLDLYVKHVAGGSPIRLTFDGAGNRMPEFSPDASRLVFRSSRDGGGIYEMPALGGAARLIARDGRDPRYSPDGLHIAFWTGPPSVSSSVPGSGGVWIASVAGGPPRRIGANLHTARHPIWSHDGTRLLVLGYSSSEAFDSSSMDWWVVAADGSSTVRSGAYDALVRAGLPPVDPGVPIRAMPDPGCWSAGDGGVTFSMTTGDTSNLWRIDVSPRTGLVAGTPSRLTTGGGRHLRPSCGKDDRLVFSQVDAQSDIWSLPVSLDRGLVTGTWQRVTRGLRNEFPSPSLDRNGRFVAFASDQSGSSNIWMRDLRTGAEVSVATSPLAQRYPVSNASGAAIAFSVYEKDQRAIYVAAPGGVADRVCEGCLRATDWSRDQKSVVIFGGSPYRISLLDVASHRQITLIDHRQHDVLYGRLSPDDRWISFTVRTQSARGRIMIAPIDGPRPVPEQAWIAIADVESDDYANWSPDGNTLYFTSGRDGYSCLWAQRIDRLSRRPVGDAFAVQHFHGRKSYEHRGWAAAGDLIAVPLVETTGDLWMMSRAGRDMD